LKILAYFIGFPGTKRIDQFIQRNQALDFFELMPAVDGRTLPIIFIESFFLEPFFKHQMKHKGSGWLGATIGCFLSHIKAVEAAEMNGADYVIVAEDDAVFRKDPRELILFMKEQRVDLLYLNDRMVPKGHSVDSSTRSVFILTNENLTGTGAEAYILSRKGINGVLQLFNRGLKNRMPTGFDGFMQSFVIGQGKKANAPGRKSLDEWVRLRKSALLFEDIDLKVGVAIPSIAAHIDEGMSIINGGGAG